MAGARRRCSIRTGCRLVVDDRRPDDPTAAIPVSECAARCEMLVGVVSRVSAAGPAGAQRCEWLGALLQKMLTPAEDEGAVELCIANTYQVTIDIRDALDECEIAFEALKAAPEPEGGDTL